MDKGDEEHHNQLKTWRLKKKLVPKNTEEPPMAKLNSHVELVTESNS